MKKTYKYIIPALVCLAAVIILRITLGINPIITMAVPYAAFCLCSFVLLNNNNKLFSILMILLSGLVVLPILYYVYSFITAPILYAIPLPIVGIIVEFVHTIIYFCLFIIVNTLINKKIYVIGKTTYILIALFALISAVLGNLLVPSFLQEILQGSWFGYLSTLNIISFSQLISSILFYLSLYLLTIRFVKKS